MKFNFQSKAIHFTLTNTFSFDEKTNKAKKYDVKMKTSQKWKFYESIQLWYLLSTYKRLSLWNVENKVAVT